MAGHLSQKLVARAGWGSASFLKAASQGWWSPPSIWGSRICLPWKSARCGFSGGFSSRQSSPSKASFPTTAVSQTWSKIPTTLIQRCTRGLVSSILPLRKEVLLEAKARSQAKPSHATKPHGENTQGNLRAASSRGRDGQKRSFSKDSIRRQLLRPNADIQVSQRGTESCFEARLQHLS